MIKLWVLPLVFTLPISEVTVVNDATVFSFTVTSNIPNLQVTMTDSTIWFVVSVGEEEFLDAAFFELCPCEAMWTLQEVRGPLIFEIEANVEAPEISIGNGALKTRLPAWALAGNTIVSVDIVWTECSDNTFEVRSQMGVITRGVRAPPIY